MRRQLFFLFLGIFVTLANSVGCGALATNVATAPTATNVPPAPTATLAPTETETLAPSVTLTRTPPATLTSFSTRTPLPTFTAIPSRTPTQPIVSYATTVPGVTCPFNQPVVRVVSDVAVNGFVWSAPILPMNDACVSGIQIDPTDENVWYVSAQSALYITRDGGRTWEKPFSQQVMAGTLKISVTDANRVYVGIGNKLYMSKDKGHAWSAVRTFDDTLMSLLSAADGTLFVGLNWGPSPNPNGIYVSHDQGATWQLLSFGMAQRGLLTWDIARDPRDGTLYVGNEIYDHPKPYHPPFLRSRDNGKTWQEISGTTINWHVISIQISPTDGTVYAMTEGAGLYKSTDQGDHWKLSAPGFGLMMLLDQNFPNRVFTGMHNGWGAPPRGGAYFSVDGGATFNRIGLVGAMVGSLVLNHDSTKMYVASYSSGIYVTKIPAGAIPK